MTNHYEILDVSPDAKVSEIKAAYRRQAMKWHPDRKGSSPEATVRFQQIAEAYRVLRDPALRNEYDAYLRKKQSESSTAYQTYEETESREDRQEDTKREGNADHIFWEEMIELAYELFEAGYEEKEIAMNLARRGCPPDISVELAKAVYKSNESSSTTKPEYEYNNHESKGESISSTPGEDISKLKKLYAAYIGPKNTEYYLEKFMDIHSGGKRKISWNWSALLFGGWWYMYRGVLYPGFLILMLNFITPPVLFYPSHVYRELQYYSAGAEEITTLIPGIIFFLLIYVFTAIYGNYFYHRKVKKIAYEAWGMDKGSPSEETILWIKKKRGDEVLKTFITILCVLFFFALLLNIELKGNSSSIKKSSIGNNQSVSVIPSNKYIRTIPQLRVQWIEVIKSGEVENIRGILPSVIKAAEYGDAFSQSFLCSAYSSGEYFEKNITEAIYWCKKGANNDGRLALKIREHRDLDAEVSMLRVVTRVCAHNLGALYWHEEGVKKDANEAMHWYRVAVEAGYAPSAFGLLNMYYSDDLANEDLVLAYAWLIQAEKLGFEDEEFLKEMYSILDVEISDMDLAKAVELGSLDVNDMPR